MNDVRAEMIGGPRDGLRLHVSGIPRVRFPVECPQHVAVRPADELDAAMGEPCVVYAVYLREDCAERRYRYCCIEDAHGTVLVRA